MRSTPLTEYSAMPYIIKKRGDKFRIIDKNTGKVARRSTGKPVDGGGKKTKSAVMPQMQAMNIEYAKERGAKIPPAPKKKKAKPKRKTY